MCACLVALTSLTSQYLVRQSNTVSHLSIGFIFSLTYSIPGIDPLVIAYAVEYMHTNTRARGIGLNAFSCNLAKFINTYCALITIGPIGWTLYIICTVWNII